ncbi:MAG: hypothetical protein WBI17_06280 [Clostridiaceae bacterium]
MKYLGYLILGIIIFGAVEFVSIGVGQTLGSGPAEAGIIVSSISALSAIVVICTMILVDTIKNK